MRLPRRDGSLTWVVVVLTILCVVPFVIGLGIWSTAPSATDASLLFGLLASLVLLGCFLLVLALGSFISGLLGE